MHELKIKKMIFENEKLFIKHVTIKMHTSYMDNLFMKPSLSKQKYVSLALILQFFVSTQYVWKIKTDASINSKELSLGI